MSILLTEGEEARESLKKYYRFVKVCVLKHCNKKYGCDWDNERHPGICPTCGYKMDDRKKKEK